MKLLENLIKKHIKKNDTLIDKKLFTNSNIDTNKSVNNSIFTSNKVNVNSMISNDESIIDDQSAYNYNDHNISTNGVSVNVSNSMNNYLNKFKLTNLNDFFNILSDLKSISQTYFIIDEIHNLDLLLRNKKFFKKFFDICICFDIKFLLISNFDMKNSEVCSWLNLESFHTIYFTNVKERGCTWNFCEKWIQQRHHDMIENNFYAEEESSLGLKEIDEMELNNLSKEIVVSQNVNKNKKKSKSKSNNSIKSDSINTKLNLTSNGMNGNCNKNGNHDNSMINNEYKNGNIKKDKSKSNTNSIVDKRKVNVNMLNGSTTDDKIEFKLIDRIVKKEENKLFFLYEPLFYINILEVRINFQKYPAEAKESIITLLRSCISQYTIFTININEIMYNFILIVHNFITLETNISNRLNYMYDDLDKKSLQLAQYKQSKNSNVIVVSNNSVNDEEDQTINKFDSKSNTVNINNRFSYKSTFINKDVLKANTKRINFLIKFQVYNTLIHTASHNEFFKDIKAIIETNGKTDNNPRLKLLNDAIEGKAPNKYISKSRFIGDTNFSEYNNKVSDKNTVNSDYGLVSSGEYSLCGKKFI